MKVRIAALFLTLIFLAVIAASQNSIVTTVAPPPDVLTTQTNAAIALTAYKSWMEARLTELYANDATLEYLKTRKQFGVAIGSFQALQHRMVDMVISGEQAKSMAGLACAKVDAATDPVERKRIVSAAKIKIADACRHVAQEAIQLHGGMGMSDELNIGHYFKRISAINIQFGDPAFHVLRYAQMDAAA